MPSLPPPGSAGSAGSCRVASSMAALTRGSQRSFSATRSTALLVGVQVAERLRRIIAERPLLCGGQPIDISASLGVDAFHAGQQDSAEAFVKRTDELLYRAKQAGRNRVCHATASGLDTAASVSREEKDALFGLFDKPP